MFLRLFLVFISFQLCQSVQISIWGPGLRPDNIVLPARYFFIEFRPEDESSRVLKNDLKVDISGESPSGRCRIWVDILDRKDNSFIVRYRFYETCYNVVINVKFKNSHIGESPYTYKGPIYNEGCDCPETDFSQWISNNECPKEMEQINKDMALFNKINMKKVFKDVTKTFNNPGATSYCFYIIKNNELYRKCYGQHVGFNMFSDAILTSILRKVVLPDQSFFINLGDWPLASKKFDKPLPMFSWCGSDDTYDIVLPTYDITEATLENMGRVMLDMLSVQGNIDKKWEEKIEQAFWRGRDACRARLDLIDIARDNPTMFNASLTNFFFFRDEEKKYGPKTPHVSFFKFFDYKYQINIDGSVAAYRFPYLLAGDSLVLKQESPYYEHFYKQLTAGVHYLSFRRDLKDLTKKIKWAMENDDEARAIAKRGRDFARENLLPKEIMCYYALALNEWGKRIVKNVDISEDMEKIPKSDDKSHCECLRNKKDHKNDEL